MWKMNPKTIFSEYFEGREKSKIDAIRRGPHLGCWFKAQNVEVFTVKDSNAMAYNLKCNSNSLTPAKSHKPKKIKEETKEVSESYINAAYHKNG